MNKICTSIEQSKKLIELGIDVDTSDMVYLKSYFEEEGEYNLLTGSYHEGYMEKDDGSLIPIFDEHIPAWSLATLLTLIPKEQHPELVLNAHYKWICDISKPFSFAYKPTVGDNPLDVVFKMIVWLKENEKI